MKMNERGEGSVSRNPPGRSGGVRRQVTALGQSVGVSKPTEGGDAGDVGDAYTVIDESRGNVTVAVES